VKQVSGNLWTLPADARCITVNGATRQDGQAVMGRGVAAQAKERWPMLPAVLGELIRQHGNHVQLLMSPETIQPPFDDTAHLVAFPVKWHWQHPADLALIQRSCGELMALADRARLRAILLPRPGCGNGRLSWFQVEPVIAPLLDDRVTVVDLPTISGAVRTRDETRKRNAHQYPIRNMQ
jgi:O-acetyl-ADP-ribose deacetylase (regulator of RNase III)